MTRPSLRRLSKQIADRVSVDWPSFLYGVDADRRAALRTVEQLTARPPRNATWSTNASWEHRLASVIGICAIAQVALALLTLSTEQLPSAGHVPPALQLTTMYLSTLSAGVLASLGHRDPAARGLALVYAGLAAAFADVLAPSPPEWISGSLRQWSIVLLRLPGDLALPAGLWIFVLHFPQAELGTTAQQTTKWFARVVIVFAAALLILHFLLEFTQGAARNLAALSVFDRQNRDSYYWVLYFGVLALAMPVAALKFRLEYLAARRRVQRFMVALAFGFGPVAALSVLGSSSAVGAQFLRDPRVFPTATVLVFAGLWTLPFSTAAAVLARDALPLRWALRRSIHYSLAQSTLALTIALPLLVSAVLLLANPARTIDDFLRDGGGMALGISALALLLLTFRHRILTSVDGVLSQSRVDARQLITEMGLTTRRRMSARDVVEALLTAIGKACHPQYCAFLICSEGGELVPLLGGADRLPSESALRRLLEVSPAALPLRGPDAALARLLPAADVEWVAQQDWHILVPVHGHGEALVGATCLGPLISGADYSGDDCATLEALCASAGPLLTTRLTECIERNHDESTFAAECTRCGRLLEEFASACPCGGTVAGSVLHSRVVGRYRLLRRLGAGGMGVVYEALDESLGRRVALKTLPEVGPREAEQLQREARTMASLDHRRLAFVLGFETVGPRPVLVVEYLSGGTLADRLRSTGALARRDVVAIGSALCDALIYLHDAGVLHRDLKPSNVGFTGGGEPKLLDFGVAAAAFGPEARNAAGTTLYMAPEVLRGDPATPLCDLWSLGVVLCEAWIGRHPLQGLVKDEQRDILLDGSLTTRTSKLLPPGTPLTAVLQKGLSSDASQRYQTALELQRALQACNM